jgi:hypothetical protein
MVRVRSGQAPRLALGSGHFADHPRAWRDDASAFFLTRVVVD